MKFIQDIGNTALRYLKSQVQTPYFLVFSVAQPIFWLVIFGQLFDGLFQTGNSISYIQYITPGIIVMNVLFDAGYSGMSIVEDINYGLFEKILVTPTSKGAIVLGSLLASIVSIFIQIGIILGIAVVMGFCFQGNVLDFLAMFLAVALLTFGFAGCSKAIAFATKKEDPVVIIINFITMPLLFLSSILLPTDSLPKWAKVLSSCNPLEHTVRIVREFSYQNTGYNVGRDYLFLVVFAGIAFFLCVKAIYKCLD